MNWADWWIGFTAGIFALVVFIFAAAALAIHAIKSHPENIARVLTHAMMKRSRSTEPHATISGRQ